MNISQFIYQSIVDGPLRMFPDWKYYSDAVNILLHDFDEHIKFL